MFSYEERLNVITLYIANKYNAKKTAAQLGNVSESSIRSWYKEYRVGGANQPPNTLILCIIYLNV